AVYSLIDRWVRAGCPPGKSLSGFRFRRFEEAVQWILENAFDPRLRLFGADYGETKRKLADPDFDLLRGVLRAALEQTLPQPVSATDLARLAVAQGLMTEAGDQEAKLKVGRMLGRYLNEAEIAVIGEFTVQMECRNDSSTFYKDLRLYRINRTALGD
ncbi:MAG: hypothetical protein KDM64_19465, partial [Verrucomicrobiae bacterium]|nr:hypothetical protein [Verrucomicrobiae bacterium]